MRLPRGGEALVDPRKLADYVLSPTHPRRRHKARVFESALGLTAKQAPLLQAALLSAAREHEAVPARCSRRGRVVRGRVRGQPRTNLRSRFISGIRPAPPGPPGAGRGLTSLSQGSNSAPTGRSGRRRRCRW
ncbi:MAG: DUF6883 domain-containing protein [Caulobacteraceae bacterium]